MNDTLTAIAGFEVGHWTDREAATGCTVVVLPEPNCITAEFRGAAPGSRESALLYPGMAVEQAQAVVLTGGSAFGLAAADGVARELEKDGRGHPTLMGPVPIVPAAVVYDLHTGDATIRPGSEEGASAYRAARSAPVEMGRVGAGTGTRVAGWRGLENSRPGGLGSALVRRDGFSVGALAVVNSVGDVFTLEGTPLTGGSPVPGPPVPVTSPLEQTTLVVVATDARLPRSLLLRLAVRSHDALAVCVRPTHTSHDGDAVFAVSSGTTDVAADAVAEAAWEATGRAVEAAVTTAVTADAPER
ncbi:MAG TPA: P1 family peptidase [Acidimicrobiia bacterium]|nr:P1 family peptidase [Acidimicrobiia bacterium]